MPPRRAKARTPPAGPSLDEVARLLARADVNAPSPNVAPVAVNVPPSARAALRNTPPEVVREGGPIVRGRSPHPGYQYHSNGAVTMDVQEWMNNPLALDKKQFKDMLWRLDSDKVAKLYAYFRLTGADKAEAVVRFVFSPAALVVLYKTWNVLPSGVCMQTAGTWFNTLTALTFNSRERTAICAMLWMAEQ